MNCPVCGLEAQITQSSTEVTGDKSPEEQTRIFTVLTFSCRNPQCARSGQQVGQVKHQVFPEVPEPS